MFGRKKLKQIIDKLLAENRKLNLLNFDLRQSNEIIKSALPKIRVIDTLDIKCIDNCLWVNVFAHVVSYGDSEIKRMETLHLTMRKGMDFELAKMQINSELFKKGYVYVNHKQI